MTKQTPKKKTSFALSQEAIDQLLEVSQADKRSQASMLEVLIERAYNALKAQQNPI